MCASPDISDSYWLCHVPAYTLNLPYREEIKEQHGRNNSIHVNWSEYWSHCTWFLLSSLAWLNLKLPITEVLAASTVWEFDRLTYCRYAGCSDFECGMTWWWVWGRSFHNLLISTWAANYVDRSSGLTFQSHLVRFMMHLQTQSNICLNGIVEVTWNAIFFACFILCTLQIESVFVWEVWCRRT